MGLLLGPIGPGCDHSHKIPDRLGISPRVFIWPSAEAYDEHAPKTSKAIL